MGGLTAEAFRRDRAEAQRAPQTRPLLTDIPVSDGVDFRRHDSGLYVPDEVSRAREVWTREEWKALDRAMRLLTARGVTFFLGCPNARCQRAPIERIANVDGSVTLRCAHKDRVFRRG